MKKYILSSIILLLAAANTAWGQNVAKIGSTEYATLKAAVTDAADGATIEIIADITELQNGLELEINKSLTITGATDAQGNPLYTIYGKNDATGTNDIFITGSGTVTLSNLKVKQFGNNAATDIGHAPIYVSSNFTGTVNLENLYVSEFNRGGIFLYGGNFNVTDCYIDCANSKDGAFTKGIEIKNTATGTIEDTFICNMERSTTAYASAGIEIYGSGEITVDKCTIISNNGDHESTKETYGIVIAPVGAYDPAGGSLTVTETMINSTQGALSVDANDYAVELTDCSFDNYMVIWNDGSEVVINSGDYAEDVYADAGTFTIHGGEFTSFAPYTGTEGSIVIDGGTFDKPVREEYCAEGYSPKDNGDGTYGVESNYVAQIGTTKYVSLQAALDAATAGQTITLLKDIDLGSSYQIINKAVTIDGGTNQYEIKGTGSSSGTDTESTIVLQGSGAVTLKNLKITNSSSNNNGVGIRGTAYSGKLTIDNCIITVPMRGVNVMTIADGFSMDITSSTIQSNVDDPTTAYVDAVDSRGISFSDEDELATTVTITNTTIQGFKNDIYVDATKKSLTLTMDGVEAYGLYMLNLSGENSTVNLNGGTTFSASSGGSLVTDEAAYAASTNIIYLDEATKTATSNNVLNAVTTLTAVGVGSGKYKLETASAATGVAQIGNVKYATLQAAVDAANAGETIKVIVAGDYTLPNLPKNITIEGSVDGVVFNHTTAGSVASIPNGATFKNVEFNFGNVNYHGFQHAGTINMEGCTLNGKLFSYGDMNFTDCSFNQSNSDYHMWAYSGNLTYTGCTFTNTATGKFINVYNESGATKYTVTTTNCTFVNQGSSNKAALNVKATSGSNLLAYDVIINNCTTEGAFPEASTSDALVVLNSVVQVDDRPSGADNITVTQDGVLIYPVPEKSVAQIGTTGYPTLQAAVDAAKALGGEVTINIIDDISGETVTIQEVANFKLTIDGQKDASSNYTVDATIVVDGLRSNGGSPTNGASVRLQNIAFVKTTATDGIQASHYAHNLTIQDCTYSGFDNDKWFLNASVDGPLYGVTVKNVTVEHARLIYGNLADDAVFQNITATTDCKVGFNVKTSGTALIENCQVTTGKYAFRDYSDGYTGTFTLKDNTFTSTSTAADEGVIVNRGGAEGTAHINVESGTYIGALKVLNNKKNVLVISGGHFSAPVGDPEYAGYFAEGLCGVNGLYEGDAPNGVGTAVASITTGETTIKFATFEAAVDAATSGETIELLANITDAYTMSEGQTLKVKKNGKSITVKAPDYFVLKSSTANDVTTYSLAEADYMFTQESNGKVTYYQISNLSAMNTGGTFKLLKDATRTTRTASSSMAGGTKIIFDLNGHTLTYTSTDASFLLSGIYGSESSLKFIEIVDNSDTGGGKLVTNAEIEITGRYYDVTIGEGVTVEGSSVLIDSKYYNKLTVEGTINGGDEFAVVTNGNTENANITIKEGAVLTSTGTAMYLPGTGTTTIEGGTITGSTGIYVKSGTLNIEGGEINGNGDDTDYRYWDNGCYSTGDALVVDNCGYPGGRPTVNVTGGTFTSTNADAIASYSYGEGNEPIANFVHGGYFSSELDREICEAGKKTVLATEKPGYFKLGDVEYVAQIGETKYETLQAAVDAAQQMGGAVTVNIIDDISGETVTIQEVANFKLTIDGQKDASSNYTVDALIIVDGLRGNGGSTTNGASVTIQNIAFVKTTATDGIQASHYPHNLTIQDCTYSGSDNDKWFFNASVDGPLYGVTIKDVTVENARLIYGNLADDAVFQNITATNNCKVGFNVKTSGTALIENCQVTTGKYAFRDYSDSYAGTFTLKDNTFTSTSEESDEGVIVNRGGVVGTNHINVESGTYTGHVKVLNNKEGVLAISGGYFSEEFPDEYIAAELLAEGYSCVPATDMEGYFTVGIPHYVAQIGEGENAVKYTTLAAAVDAVPADGTETTIVMIDDETINTNAGVTIPTGKNVVLDLNGKTVKGVVQSPASAQTILNKGTLTITDSSEGKNGTITNEVSDENAGSPGDSKNWFSNAITNNGTLTVNAGNIVNTGTGGACYAIDNITNGTTCTAVLNIAGGNISANKVAIRMFCNSTTNDNTVNVTGGVITSENAYAIQAQQANNNANKAVLNISGGTLSGEYAFCDYGNKNVATQFDNASYSITGGFFTGYIWSYATYYCGMDGFVSGGYFSNEIGGDIVAPGSACVENTDPTTMAAYPYTIGQADIYYYWLDNNNQIDGGGYYTIYAPFAGTDVALMDGEFIQLLRDVTLTKDITYIQELPSSWNADPIFKGGTFTLTFGEYNINLNGFHFPIPTGVTILTDKQTNIFSALEEGYEVVEETKETGYAYSVKKSIANPDITIIVDPATYNGTALTPVVTVKDGTTELVQGTDYTISYKGGDSNNHLVNADTYVEEIVITGIGNYGGTRYADFIILPLNLTDYVVSATAPYVAAGYGTAGADGTSGATVKEAATITIKNGSNEPLSAEVLAALDITIDNDPNTANNYNNTGTYEGVVHVTPKVDNSDPDNVIDYGPNFTGTIAPGNLIIGEGIDITNSLVVTTPNAIYTGAALPPSADNMVVKVGENVLTYETDYTFTFNGVAGDYVDAKTYQNAITITGLGEYEGTFKTDYVIAPRDLSDEGITVTTTNLSYLNTEQAVTVEVKYGDNVIPAANYTYTPNTVTEAGKHIITINAVENSNLVGSTTVVQWVFKSLEGDYAADFTVEPDPIPTQNWTGSEIKPTIIVKDKDRVMQLVDANDGDYSIVYSDNIDEGEATITITGRYAYSGSITKHFTIVSAYFTENGITYHHANEGEEVTVGNTGKTLAVDTEVTGNPVTVPTTVEHGGKSFTVIGVEQNAFGSDAITGIVLPESIAEVENGAFSGADNLHYVDLSTATGFTPSSLQRNIAASPFNGVPKQALVFLNGTTFTGENYVYNPGSGNQYYCEVFKIYDDLSGAQTGFGGNDYKWAFENPHEFTAYSVENTRQLTAERHYTICLPYALEIPNNVKAYTLEATSDKLFGFTEVTGTLAAYTPYVLIPTKSGQLLGTNNNTVVPAFPATADTDATTLNGTTASSFTMYGTMRYMEGDAAQGKYIMQYNNGNPTWKKITEASAGFEASNKACILPMRAYIINGTGGSREFFDVVFTNIDGTTLTFDKLRFDDDTIYDLSGRKVELLERGHTYIINGKKVMVK